MRDNSQRRVTYTRLQEIENAGQKDTHDTRQHNRYGEVGLRIEIFQEQGRRRYIQGGKEDSHEKSHPQHKKNTCCLIRFDIKQFIDKGLHKS